MYEISNVTATVLTLQAVGGGDAGLSDQSDDTAATVQGEPRVNKASGNGADVTISFPSGLPGQFLWEAQCQYVPHPWSRNIHGR